MKDFNVVFSSENIDYIKLSEKLIPEYLTMTNDPDVISKISYNLDSISYVEEKLWVDEMLNKNINWYSMIEKKTGDYIGNIGLIRIVDFVGEIGIVITPKKQNKHYGTESIKRIIKYGYEKFNLRSFKLNVLNENLRAIHCYEKIGFKRDKEEYRDSISMSYKLRKTNNKVQ